MSLHAYTSLFSDTHYLNLLAGVLLIYLVVWAVPAIISLSKNKTWHLGTATATGVDAAEKGDTRRLLLEKVPFDLQKRAILHKRWLMIGHASQWPDKGSYRTYTVAEIPFVVIRGEDGAVRALHNVCRHRAYPVVRRAAGRSLRLFCRYHGWRYDAAGALLRAPCFGDEATAGAGAGLFGIHLRTDAAGFVFVSFAARLADSFPWSDVSPPRPRALDFAGAEEWEVEVDVDWRLASLLPWFIEPAALSGLPWPRRCLAYLAGAQPGGPRLQYVDDASFICDIDNEYHLLVSALPADGTKTVIRMTAILQEGVAAAGRGPPAENLRRRVDAEIRAATEALRRQRTTGTNLDFRQSAIRERLDKFSRHIHHHRAAEKAAGRKINAAGRMEGAGDADVEAEAICSALEGLGPDAEPFCPVAGLDGELEW